MKAKELQVVPISKEAILERLDEKDIFNHYFQHSVDFTRNYTNPFRVDKHPGCSFYKSKNGRIYFHDFATSDTYDCFSVIMKQFNINFWEACKKINKDFDLRLGTHYPRAKIEKEKKEIAKMEDYGPPQIQVVKKAWDKKSLAYWKQFGISKKTLEFYKVHNVDKVYSNKYLTMRSTEKNPIFAYVHSTNEVKTYRPLEKRKHKKWGGNMTKNTVGGYDQLPLMGDLLIITKSHKDVMLLHELDYHAVCPSAEGTPIYKKFMDEFQAAFERIVIFYDNDEAGISGAKKLSKKYNLEMIFLPEDEPKDISDFYHKYGKVWTINILEKLLNNDKIPNNSKNRDDES